jgi:hypothetical protein
MELTSRPIPQLARAQNRLDARLRLHPDHVQEFIALNIAGYRAARQPDGTLHSRTPP